MIVSITNRLAITISSLVSKGMTVSFHQHAALSQCNENRKEHFVNIVKGLPGRMHRFASQTRPDGYWDLPDRESSKIESYQCISIRKIIRIVIVYEERH